jgi:hypothetical protein
LYGVQGSGVIEGLKNLCDKNENCIWILQYDFLIWYIIYKLWNSITIRVIFE